MKSTSNSMSNSKRECIIERVSFEVVLPVWQSELWPGRRSPIEPTSAMRWLGGIEMNLMKEKPTFWLARDPQRPIIRLGVLSGHRGGAFADGTQIYRIRGLWVAPEERRSGVARRLIEAAVAQAQLEKCQAVWTFPRRDSLPFYESVGFKKQGDWIEDKTAAEFGPNCFALLTLPQSS